MLLVLFLFTLPLVLLNELISPRLHLLCRTVELLKRRLLLDLPTVDLCRTLAYLRYRLLSGQPVGLFFVPLLFKLTVGLLFVLLVVVSLDEIVDLLGRILSFGLFLGVWRPAPVTVGVRRPFYGEKVGEGAPLRLSHLPGLLVYDGLLVYLLALFLLDNLLLLLHHSNHGVVVEHLVRSKILWQRLVVTLVDLGVAHRAILIGQVRLVVRHELGLILWTEDCLLTELLMQHLNLFSFSFFALA